MRKIKILVVGFGLLCLIKGGSTYAASQSPKYGPDAVPLSRKTNLQYFQHHAAADFWALIPFYVPQPNKYVCAATNMVWILNAKLATRFLKSDEKFLTVESFLKNYTNLDFSKLLTWTSIEDRSQVSNENLVRVMRDAVTKLGLSADRTSVEGVSIDQKNLEKSRKQFLKALHDNERSSTDFIFMSFMQDMLTGDPEGDAHVATIGAYDEKRGLVLILDPDREWYEPYWSPVEKVFAALANPRSDAKRPGWIYVRF